MHLNHVILLQKNLIKKDIPQVSQLKVRSALRRLKTNKSTVKDDIPAKVTKYLADELTEPLTVIITTAIKMASGQTYGRLPLLLQFPKNTLLQTSTN